MNNPNESITSGEVFESAYRMDNYTVVDVPDADNNRCIVFFSSAGLYYPNTEEALKHTVLEKNKYEWWQARPSYAKRYIYIRDVAKNFYLRGISKDMPNLESVIELVKDLTAGYRVTTVGSSAGGFMAMVAGCMLDNCDFVLDFSGYYNLNFLDAYKWPMLEQYKMDKNCSVWYDIKPLVKQKKCEIFRFYPAKSTEDLQQSKHVEDCDIKMFPLISKKHGIPFCKRNLYQMIEFDQSQLESFWSTFNQKHNISELRFSVHLNGLVRGAYIYVIELIRQKISRLR